MEFNYYFQYLSKVTESYFLLTR